MNVFKDKAVKLLQESAIPLLQQHPERRAKAIKGLNDIQLNAASRAFRNGRELIFNYNLSQNQIIVLKPYWDKYIPVAKPNARAMINDQEAEDFTVNYLLRETAHFWNHGSDEDSDHFSESVIWGINRSELAALKDYLSRANELLNRENDPEFDALAFAFARTGLNEVSDRVSPRLTKIMLKIFSRRWKS